MTDSTKNLPRLLCEPHDGSRSTKFLKFARDFKSGCSAEFAQNDDYSAWIALIDLDPGGNGVNAPTVGAS